MNEQISTIETKRIVANPNNPRTRIEDVSDLVASIRENGLMQPIIVRWTKQKDESGIHTGYEVIAGSRRLTACQQLGIEKISCIVRTCDDAKAFELATTENLVRENMNAADEARAVAKLFKEGKGRIEVGAIFGKSGRWAEGRRRIANLGEKALGMLEKGAITLGHAEILTMCDEDRVEVWLEAAKYRKPEELRRDILERDRRHLQNAPFNFKKVCAKCPKRSDCQMDLFGEMKDTYCLDTECYDKQIEKECKRLEKSFIDAGYKAVPEDDEFDAENELCGYINASTEDEDDKETIKSWKKKGAKAMYWINTRCAKGGLVFKDPDHEKDEDSESENQNGEIITWQDRENIRNSAKDNLRKDLRKSLEKYIEGLDDRTIAFFLTVFDDFARFEFTEVDSDGKETEYEETPLEHIGEDFIESIDSEDGEEQEKKVSQREKLLESITNNLIDYNGTEPCIAAAFGIKKYSEYFDEAKASFMESQNEKD